ncbi:energy transducer TonB [Kaistella palustris]|uniref:energy transducer TonB n=1 Tax=Kaistella palustris TaxID=493376 RepID=UPI00042A63A6|nr:hypothetical protein [Kaistella palustris]
MSGKFFLLLLLFSAKITFAQQNEEFISAKKYFDYQRYMLNSEFKKKFDKEKDRSAKVAIKDDFSEFMKKLDSIQNTAFIGTLIKVKNREDLQRLSYTNHGQSAKNNPPKTVVNAEAKYPGGFETLRKQVAEIFYSDAILPDQKYMKTNVVFVVERDGSISSVHAEGDNFTFNRQAEIAMYLLPEKFSPAMVNGSAVRYRFRLPLAMRFE